MLIYTDGYEVIKRGKIKPITYEVNERGCWVSTSHRFNHKGYADVCRNGQRKKLHRYVYELESGENIPAGLVILHECDNPACINFKHMSLGTTSDNNKDKTDKKRQTRWEEVHTAKLSMAEVKRIKGDPRSQRVIGREYGVCHSTIGRIKREENWKP